jgi:hypothetical protein
MLRILTKKEELDSRKKNFNRLKPGSLFDLCQQEWFIAIRMLNKKEWEVVEWTEDNRQRFAANKVCGLTRLHFDDMRCLNLRLQ